MWVTMNYEFCKPEETGDALECVKELHEITFGPSISKSDQSRFQDSLVSVVALQLADPYCRSVHWDDECKRSKRLDFTLQRFPT